jgi:cobalt/nickel transport system permease protein
MHIPDGFLSTPVWAVFDVLSIPAVGFMGRQAQKTLEDRQIPLLGVMGAFVFAAQMIQFPVGAGTSGHLVGGTLLAITLGPAAASVVMTAILAIQAFVFQDGGVIALGPNVFNMAVAGVLAGYLPYRAWGSGRFRTAAIFGGALLSVLTSACLALSELIFSGVAMPRRILWVSVALFLVSGLMEGAITVAAMRAITSMSIQRLNPARVDRRVEPGSRVLAGVAAVTLVLALVGVMIASNAPDGIWSLARQLSMTAHPAWLHSPAADYEIPGIESAWIRRAGAGLAGIALVWIACVLAGKLIARQRLKVGSA